jgi:hypothetical protein
MLSLNCLFFKFQYHPGSRPRNLTWFFNDQAPTSPPTPSHASDCPNLENDCQAHLLWITRRRREVARRRTAAAAGAAPAARLRFAVTALAAALPLDGKRRLLALARDYAAGAVAPPAMAASLQELVDQFAVKVPLPTTYLSCLLYIASM